MKAFLTVVETVSHQRIDDQPLAVDSNYQIPLESEEEAFLRRKVSIGEDWQSIPGNWIPHASVVIVKNDEGKTLTVIPSEDDLKATAAKIVEVAYANATKHCWLVPPGQSMRACPSDVAAIRLRCQSGKANCTIAVFPT